MSDDLTSLTEALARGMCPGSPPCTQCRSDAGLLAPAVAPLLAEREAKAWDEGYAQMVADCRRNGRCGLSPHTWNPYSHAPDGRLLTQVLIDDAYQAGWDDGHPKLARNPFGPKDPQ